MKRKLTYLLLLLFLVSGVIFYLASRNKDTTLKLYWFIPDGVRADTDIFNIYEWAREGKLPNIKRLMDEGSYGYSYPNFPSHTPTNFATLLTGAYPVVHGVNDGPMHVIGKPLSSVAIGGFRSVARKVPSIWNSLEDAGMKVAIISVPGSTPPETNKAIVLRGRWGNWGADFPAINFESRGDLEQRILQGRAARWFYFGPQLTQYTDSQKPQDWKYMPDSFSDAYEVSLLSYGTTIYALVYDSSDDSVVNYDKVIFSLDKVNYFESIKEGDWTGWHGLVLKWKSDDEDIDVSSSVNISVIKLGPDKFFRFRVYYDNLNEFITLPSDAASLTEKDIGPMIDFPDNFPPQLVYYPEDKKIFLDESNMTFEWHKNAVSSLIKNYSPDAVIHDIYSPNQMLTSKWWMGYVDPESVFYKTTNKEERDKLWLEVEDMYKRIDNIVGEILKVTDKNTVIVFSSDHGVVPLNESVNLNNLFAKNGWLKFEIDPKSGEPIIDWEKTKVIYLKMAHIYINPDSLNGDYKRASGVSYEKLRQDVISVLENLKDEKGINPVEKIVKWEDVKTELRLDPDRAGDLVIANKPGYGWNEEMTKDLKVFSTPVVTGYKQAILSEKVEGMWTPFIISGPGVMKDYFIGNTPFSLVDQYPTIMKALNLKIPDFVQGKALNIFIE